MLWSKRTFIAAAVLTMSLQMFAQDATQATELQTDQQAYCKYISQQAQAQRDLLRTPSAITGITQPSAALPMQLVWGVTSSLADIKKAGLTMNVAQKNCELYTATTSAQQDIQYALPGLEKQALQHRLKLIQQADDKLGAILASTAKMLDAQNVTRPMLFSLQTTRIKLDADRADTESKIATLYTPPVSDLPLKKTSSRKSRRRKQPHKMLSTSWPARMIGMSRSRWARASRSMHSIAGALTAQSPSATTSPAVRSTNIWIKPQTPTVTGRRPNKATLPAMLALCNSR